MLVRHFAAFLFLVSGSRISRGKSRSAREHPASKADLLSALARRAGRR